MLEYLVIGVLFLAPAILWGNQRQYGPRMPVHNRRALIFGVAVAWLVSLVMAIGFWRALLAVVAGYLAAAAYSLVAWADVCDWPAGELTESMRATLRADRRMMVALALVTLVVAAGLWILLYGWPLYEHIRRSSR